MILDGLEGNPRADILTSSQEFLRPYVPLFERLYSILFIATALYLLARYIVMPLIQRKKREQG